MSTTRILQINRSDGGVPKLPSRQAQVTSNGLVGDRQTAAGAHGGPDRALCLFSLERILALQAEGHLIYPGSAGENITISGLDWPQMHPGMRLHLGDQLIIEVTSYASPCYKIQESFVDGDYGRINQTNFPGWSRTLARVLQPGDIRIGDVIRLEDPLNSG
jgi:MOSC domain-containing protein YiiM